MIGRYSKFKLHFMESGQSLVETALGSIVLIILVMGLIDLGRIYYLYIALEDSAGEAAIYLSINPECPRASSGSECEGTNNAEWRAIHASGGDIDWSNVQYSYEIPDGPNAGTDVFVTLQYDFKLVTPIISRIAEATHLKLTASASQKIVFE